ncbi:aconitate hydratase AcnA [Pelagibacteraceae bacterium]|nr:aconitate hydratase AcnA [Pelagibacteraceae bacterium]
MKNINSFNSERIIEINNQKFKYFDLNKAAEYFDLDLNKTPISIKIIIENLLRNEDGENISKDMISRVFNSLKQNDKKDEKIEIAFFPTRVLMQDFTGVPAVADLAAMRNALKSRGIEPKKINPLSRVDLVIDHSVMVDKYKDNNALKENVRKEFDRNKERYEFLKWGQSSFNNFYLVPPGAGICHQVNLENIAKTVWLKEIGNQSYLFPDSVVGTDSHTTMVNSLSVLGWGVGGIEAEAAMLGQAISMNIPEVIGFELKGSLKEGITATDLVLSITKILRDKGVVGKFVEFFGGGLKNLSLADRATISNMAPEYGATCGFFPTDEETINYLKLTGKENDHLNIVKEYSEKQNLWADENYAPDYSDKILLDLDTIEPTLAGPKRPQDKILLKEVPNEFSKMDNIKRINDNKLNTGDIVIAAITSCTNTSNPNVMIAAGLVAKKAIDLGLEIKPWVKTSLAPGSKVVSDYLNKAGLTKYLEILGFNTVGYGCTTCIGNSGPLDEWISHEIKKNNLTVCSVLSGNRNFEGRVHQEVKANFLASPPLVVAYAIAGNININLSTDCIGKSKSGHEIFLKDLWPSNKEINQTVNSCLTPEMFKERYKEIYEGDDNWKSIKNSKNTTYNWNDTSTYIKHPPFFSTQNKFELRDIKDARILALLGDSVTTDHISPAGSIKESSPAGIYLTNRQINSRNFNSYGSRRGNHEIMMRGTFANIRIKNMILDAVEGGYTKSFISNKQMSIYDAAQEYINSNIDTVIIAGKEYGTGSSRDWAAKGTRLLGVRAVIAESFERIHRSNLIGMGVLPLEFINNENKSNLNIEGKERISIFGLSELKPGAYLNCEIISKKSKNIKLKCRIDTKKELEYYKAGGILNYVLNEIISEAA